MKISLLLPIIFSIGLMADAEERAHTNAIELNDLFTLMERKHTNTIELNDLFTLIEEGTAQETPESRQTPETAGIIEGETLHVPPMAAGHIRGSERSLHVPFVETSAAITEKTAIKNMPPTLIAVDGRLNDALWKKAEVSGKFWCSLENKSPADPTAIWAARDATYLYFAIHLYDSDPTKIQAAETVRDTGFGFDDTITVQLDTFFNRRDISSFSVNPLGTQSDDIAGGRSSRIQWKGDWLGAAERTDDGWTAEFAIPFSMLNYQQKSTVFGVNFKRYQSRTKEYSWWADITPQSRPEEMGQLRGLELPMAATSRNKRWTMMPYVLAGKNIPDKKGNIKDTLVTGGIDIRYQPRPDLTGMISLNPDFSQVERAYTDLSFSYTEKFLEDNRPFFVEGKDYFSDDDEYFYSNRAADFDFGGKGFGRVGNTQFGVLATRAPEDRYDSVGRVSVELDDTHSVGATLTATHQDLFKNALAVARVSGRETSGFEYGLDAAITDTDGEESTFPGYPTVTGQGSHLKGSLGWQWDYLFLNGHVDQYDLDYFPALALLAQDLPGTRGGSATAGYYREQSDQLWRVVNSYASFDYRETEDGWLQRKKWLAGSSVEFQLPVRIRGDIAEGPYRSRLRIPDPYRYLKDYIRPDFRDEVNEDSFYSLSMDLNTRSSVFSCGAAYDWGLLAGGDYERESIYAWCRPVSELFLQATYEISDSDYGFYRLKARQAVLSGSWEITPENSLAFRYIYYESEDGFNDGIDEYYRLAYGRKARNGLDIFLVYDKDPYLAEQYSLKLVYAF